MPDNPNTVYLWCVSGIAILVALNTVIRLISERYRFPKDDLSDDDRGLIWRAVVFLVYPCLVLLELRATIVGTELLSGSVDNWTYGFLWYEVVPSSIARNLLIPALFSGELAILLLTILIVPVLFFRPHPFMSTLIGYSATFVMSVNLIIEPLLSFTGLGGNKWTLALESGATEQILPLVLGHLVLAGAFILIVRNSHIRMWFSELSRPEASDMLKQAIDEYRSFNNQNANDETARITCRLGLLYDRAGLKRQSKKQLKLLERQWADSIYTAFLKAMVAYRHCRFEDARAYFVVASDYPGVGEALKASLLAAAGCAAFAHGDAVGALNLAERALEFDDDSLVARMVKVDAYLKIGRKEQAADEILIAIHSGLTLDLENKVPLDLEKTFNAIASIDETQPVARALSAISKN